jgi:antirestriction protein ArdC
MAQNVLSQHSRDIHRTITEKIVSAIQTGPGTYEMPWHRQKGRIARPVNASTGKAYRGVNVPSLWVEAWSKGFATGYWASYRQWQELGAQVMKGERGTVVVFYQKVEPLPGADSDTPRRFVSRWSAVFNSAQVTGWDPPEQPKVSMVQTLEGVDKAITATGAAIREGHYDLACYDWALDRIDMPARTLFKGTATCTPTEAFYATLLHELVHWTGHQSRLARDLKNRFGSEAYAIEELVAELGSAFLAADLGIATEPRADHAAYVADWLKVIKSDPFAISSASARASAAVDFVLSK